MKNEVKNAIYKVCFYAGISIGFAMVKMQTIGKKVRSSI